MPERCRRVRGARQGGADLLQQVDDRACAVGGRRRRGGDHADDADASAHPADHQLSRAGPLDPARRRAKCCARRAHPQRHFQFLRLRRPERHPGDVAGTGVMTLSGKRRVLVTGGARGLGAAIVAALAAAGHDVTFTFHASADAATAAANQLAAAYPQQTFTALRVDLADREAVAAFTPTLGNDAPYSGFVHNAGHTYDALAMMMDQ